MNSPRRAGAFFDIDGTVLPGPSLEVRFAWWLLTQNRIAKAHLALWGTEAAMALVRGDRRAFHANKKYLAGLPESLLSLWGESLEPRDLAIFPKVAERIGWHASQGHHLCFVSGTLESLARVLADRLAGSVEIHATKLEATGGIWTGRVQGNHATGYEKARIVRGIARRHGLSLEASFAYGNHPDDVPMLESVGNPIIVNPEFNLRKIAVRRNWRIERWAIRSATRLVVGAVTSIASSEEAH